MDFVTRYFQEVQQVAAGIDTAAVNRIIELMVASATAAGGCSSSGSAAAPATPGTPSTTSARSPTSRRTPRPTTSPS